MSDFEPKILKSSAATELYIELSFLFTYQLGLRNTVPLKDPRGRQKPPSEAPDAVYCSDNSALQQTALHKGVTQTTHL